MIGRGARLTVLAGLLALAACGGDRAPVAEPAPLPSTTKFPTDVALLTRADLAFADLHSRLRADYDPPYEISRYEVAAATSWDTITAHYAQALGTDWRVDTRYQDDAGTSYKSRVWTDGDRAVAIALATGPDSRNVLVVLWPDDA